MAISFGKALIKVFGSRNERLLKRYSRIVDQINAREDDIRKMTDPELRERTQELRNLLTNGKIQPSEVLPEAFAIIRESMDRHIGIRSIFDPENHFDPDKFDDEMLAGVRRGAADDDRHGPIVDDGSYPAENS